MLDAIRAETAPPVGDEPRELPSLAEMFDDLPGARVLAATPPRVVLAPSAGRATRFAQEHDFPLPTLPGSASTGPDVRASIAIGAAETLATLAEEL